MDEILASIRRIIETGDERENKNSEALLSISPDPEFIASSDNDVASSAMSPVPPFDVHYLPAALAEEPAAARLPEQETADASDERAVVEIDAEPSGGETSQPAAAVEAADEAVSPPAEDAVSDDAWWDAAIADANNVEADAGEAQPATALAGNVELPAPDNENAASQANTRREAEAGADVPPPLLAEPVQPAAAALLQAEADPAPVRPAYAPAAELADPAPAERPVRQEMPESVISGASALLSAQAGDQVAAAFDDLTKAIREGQMRSMEGMAREIMRPMLQEWLDDNLPRIVERLVREEIERIARGPRR